MGPIFEKRVAFALVIAPLLLPFLLIATLGVEMLLWDEFYYTDFVRAVREGTPWSHWIWLQHNEHRAVPMKLVMIPNALFFHWSRTAEMYVSAFLCTLVVLGLWRLYRRSGGSDLLLFAPVAWLTCSVSQYENLLHGMMTCHWFTVLGIVWALVCLDHPGAEPGRGPGFGRFAAAVFFGCLASFSILNGFLVWPVGLFLLLARRRWGAAAGWLVIGLAATALYLKDFQLPGPSPFHPSPSMIVKTGFYALISLGAPLAGGSVSWGFAVGILLIALAAATVWRWRRGGWELLREEALPAALFLFGLLSCAMVSVGRVSMSVPALQPRFITYTSLAVVGGYLLLCQGLRRRGRTIATSPGFAAAFGLLSVGIVAANLHGYDVARDFHVGRLRDKYILQTFEQQRDQDLAPLYFVPELRKFAPYLREARLGPFAAQPDVLLLVRWQEGTLLGEILPGRAVEETLVCPVQDLHDLEISFATFARANTSQVRVTLESGDRRITSRTLPAWAVPDSAWFHIPLDEPFRGCAGREIRIRIESTDAVKGNAVTLWTYPPYYQGTLRQGGEPVPGRSLGLMLNGLHSGAL